MLLRVIQLGSNARQLVLQSPRPLFNVSEFVNVVLEAIVSVETICCKAKGAADLIVERTAFPLEGALSNSKAFDATLNTLPNSVRHRGDSCDRALARLCLVCSPLGAVDVVLGCDRRKHFPPPFVRRRSDRAQ
jgi:hypothetical protein